MEQNKKETWCKRKEAAQESRQWLHLEGENIDYPGFAFVF